MTRLSPDFLRRPVAHRGLHDLSLGRPENSLAAFTAAIDAGYAIELDLQLSRDGIAMVFHDDTLERLTGATGPVSARDAGELGGLALHGTAERIPSFARTLAMVAGRAPLLVEIKDQGGDPRHATDALVDAALAALAGYGGPVALMSFNPWAVARMAAARPDLACGLTQEPGISLWPDLPELDRAAFSPCADPRDFGGSFTSYHWRDLADPEVAAMAAAGIDILCWTIRSPEAEAEARRIAANITFEGYAAPLPAAAS